MIVCYAASCTHIEHIYTEHTSNQARRNDIFVCGMHESEDDGPCYSNSGVTVAAAVGLMARDHPHHAKATPPFKHVYCTLHI